VSGPLPDPPRSEPAAVEPARVPTPATPAEQRPCPEGTASRSVSAAALKVGAGSAPAASSERAATEPALVDLNSADARQLQRLPGVGAKRAQAIIELRERLGGFRAPSDLLRIRGIGRRMLERMAPEVVVRPRSEAPEAIPEQPVLINPGREQLIPPRPGGR
jgi:competence protein ComEA